MQMLWSSLFSFPLPLTKKWISPFSTMIKLLRRVFQEFFRDEGIQALNCGQWTIVDYEPHTSFDQIVIGQLAIQYEREATFS